MKQLTLLILVCFAFACGANAQPPKWSFTVAAPPGNPDGFVKHSVFDGSGGTAWNLQFDGANPRASVLLWLDANGNTIFSNAFHNTTLRLARFTRTELAVQVRVKDSGTDETTTNYVLRIRRSGRGVTTSQFPVGFGEDAGGSVGTPSDVRGLFTSDARSEAIVIRHYTN